MGQADSMMHSTTSSITHLSQGTRFFMVHLPVRNRPSLLIAASFAAYFELLICDLTKFIIKGKLINALLIFTVCPETITKNIKTLSDIRYIDL